MLIELKKLIIVNEGYKRNISLNKMYINSDHIISITDYNGAKQFLISEGSQEFVNESFSLIKISNLNKSEDIIVLGSSQEIFSKFNETKKGVLLNG
tara:strand:- start:2149 stop:2436 length:288 start_codon:yes stop_codon:yes gene_type:complete